MTRQRGFTLVEVLLVVVLVGILSTLAIVGYRRHINATKTAEAAHNIAGIAIAQQARKEETGTYINVSGSLNNLYPAATPGAFKTAWGGPCSACLQPWTSLTFYPDAPVSFGYATVASHAAIPDGTSSSSSSSSGGSSSGVHFGVGGGSDPTSIPDPDHPGEYLPDATGPYFTIVAKGDTDGNGIYASALYYSETNAIVFDLAGE